jgi:hypothetical protein
MDWGVEASRGWPVRLGDTVQGAAAEWNNRVLTRGRGGPVIDGRSRRKTKLRSCRKVWLVNEYLIRRGERKGALKKGLAVAAAQYEVVMSDSGDMKPRKAPRPSPHKASAPSHDG